MVESSKTEPRQAQEPSAPGKLARLFGEAANRTSLAGGGATTFILAGLVIMIWVVAGPIFGFSDTWQLIINTATTIITFLMVFLIQNTQNRDAKAIHLKLDELIRAVEGARTHLVDLENLTDEELDRLEREFRRIHEREKRKEELA